MKTYLEYKDDKSNKFWEVSTQENCIISRYGKIGSEGIEKSTEFDSDAIAVLEMHKQIIAKRKKGYASLDVISMDELLENKITSLEAIDKELYSDLEGSYESVIFIDGNLSLENLDLDDYGTSVNGLIVNGDLKVDGGIKNLNGDKGPFLIVKGDVLADYVIGGGSEIYFEGTSYIQTFTIGHYNHGILELFGFSLFLFNSDHDNRTEIDEVAGISQNDFDLYDDEDHIEEFVEIFGKKAAFIEVDEDDEDECFIDLDEFNLLVVKNKERLKLLKKLLDHLEE